MKKNVGANKTKRNQEKDNDKKMLFTEKMKTRKRAKKKKIQ